MKGWVCALGTSSLYSHLFVTYLCYGYNRSLFVIRRRKKEALFHGIFRSQAAAAEC
jgi:hypothetical protein